ncbi:phage tail fiber protein [Mesorhizobium sp.]|uniref:phage tail fiber domain-containing protein n=1 Tax=Mesorhizobium sp. TaxID=1871066 RepID=UPI000FE4654A|nr:phage tail fiber protein [Mesorhizobium sp.]RWM84306.1 MAG: hypothetical protein EOR83_16925 [Mesorhizobium sp.]
MATSYVIYPSTDGSQTDYAIPFEYLSQDYVKATVDGAPASFTFLSTYMVRFSVAPVGVLKIYRETSKDPINTYTNGSIFFDSQLNASLIQTIHISEEVADASLQNSNDGNWDGLNRTLKNVADPVAPQDVVTRGWAETAGTSVLANTIAAKDGAEAARSGAEIARSIAEGFASDIVSQGNVPVYSSRSAVASLSIPAGITALRTNGYSSAGDGGAALYKRVASQPSHAGRVQSADGAWWELVEGQNTGPDHLGAVGDAVANDNTPVSDAMSRRSAGSKRYKVTSVFSRDNVEISERFIDTGVTSNPVARISNLTNYFKFTGQLYSVDGQGINDVSVGASKVLVHGADIDGASYGILSDDASNLDKFIINASFIHSRRSTAIEFNSPAGNQKNRIISSCILSTAYAHTSTGSGWAGGISGVKGWIFNGNLVLGTRSEGFHVEDEQRDGLLANSVWKRTLGHGAYLSRSAVSAGQGECDGFNVGNVSFKHASVDPALIATSTTSLEIGTGVKVWTVSSGKEYEVNMTVVAVSDANQANYMEGLVTAFDPVLNLLTVNVTVVGGSGTFTDWTIKCKRSGRYGIYQVSAADGGLPSMTYANVRVAGYEHGFNIGAGAGRRNAMMANCFAQDCDVGINLTAGGCVRGELQTERCPTLIRANNASAIESVVTETSPTTILKYVGTTTGLGVNIQHLQFPRLLTHGGAGTQVFDLMDMPLILKGRVTLSLNNNTHNFFASFDVTVTGGTAGNSATYVLTPEDTTAVRHEGNMSGATLINNAGRLALSVSSTTPITARTLVVDIQGQIYAEADILAY